MRQQLWGNIGHQTRVMLKAKAFQSAQDASERMAVHFGETGTSFSKPPTLKCVPSCLLQVCSQQMCGCLWEAAIMASIAVLFIFVTGLFVGDAESESSVSDRPLGLGFAASRTTFSLPAFLNVNCISSVSGRYGQTSVLQCRINTSNVEVENPQISWLSWLKDDEPVLLYNGQTLVPPSGYSFAQRSWKESLDVSLSIADTRVEHEGVYTCQVAVSGTNAWARTRLKVAGELLTLVLTLTFVAAQLQASGPPGQGRGEFSTVGLAFAFPLTHVLHVLQSRRFFIAVNILLLFLWKAHKSA